MSKINKMKFHEVIRYLILAIQTAANLCHGAMVQNILSYKIKSMKVLVQNFWFKYNPLASYTVYTFHSILYDPLVDCDISWASFDRVCALPNVDFLIL